MIPNYSTVHVEALMKTHREARRWHWLLCKWDNHLICIQSLSQAAPTACKQDVEVPLSINSKWDRERDNFTRHTWRMFLIQIALLCPRCIAVQRVHWEWVWQGRGEKKGELAKTGWVNYLSWASVRMYVCMYRACGPRRRLAPVTPRSPCVCNQSGMAS